VVVVLLVVLLSWASLLFFCFRACCGVGVNCGTASSSMTSVVDLRARAARFALGAEAEGAEAVAEAEAEVEAVGAEVCAAVAL
jgi:hypothetical protein